ncbi:restriction endonuclease subunit S [Corynebacterium flavescens]|uniref:restriction endonuclease subunit S n=1 Tax=Corynebacterium flavescens TaxID=28028 RepID=UPI0023F297E4
MKRNKWPSVALKHLVRFGNGRDHSSVEDVDGQYPVLGSGGPFAWASEYLYDGESVLFGRKGTIDKPRYINGRFWTVDTMYFTIIGPNIVPRWLYYWATTIPFSKYATNTALPSMTSGILGSLRLKLPTLLEQQQIADYLDRETAEIDAFITELGELSALTTERLRSEAAELLTPPSQRGSGWINAHLGPLVSIATGQVDPQKDPYRGMPLIAPNHIESRTSRLLGLETAEEQGADSGKYLAREGQVLFSKIRPTLMKSTLAPADCLTSADMYPIDANSGFLTNAFLLEYLLGPQFEGFAARESARVAMPKLNRETLSSAPISLPPLEYQHRMVKKMQKARLHAREHLAEVETAVRLGQERRAALISAAVTGQIDVSTRDVSVAEQLRDELEVHV